MGKLDKDIMKKYSFSIGFSSLIVLMFLISALTTPLKKQFLIFGGLVVLYIVYEVFDLITLSKSGKTFSFTGKCVQVHKPVYDAKIQKFYGESKIILDNDQEQCVVPINHNFEVNEDDIVTVICKEVDMFKDDTLTNITKPLVVRIEKYV